MERGSLFYTGVIATPRTHKMKALPKTSFPLCTRKICKNHRFFFLSIQSLGCYTGSVCGGFHIEFCG